MFHKNSSFPNNGSSLARESSMSCSSREGKKSEIRNIKERLIQGYLAFLNGDLNIAELTYYDLYKDFPDSQLVIYNLVLVLLKKGDVESAKEILENFLKRRQALKNRAKIRISKSLLLLKFLIDLITDKVTKAVNFLRNNMLEELYIVPPDWEELPNIELNLVEIFEADEEDLGKLQRFFSFPKKSEYILPINKRIRKFLYLLLKKKTSENQVAEQDFLRGILAIVSLSLDRIREAKELLLMMPRESTQPDIYIIRGKIKYIIGDLNGAFRDFHEALKLLENKTERYIPLANLSALYMRIGEYERAIELINEALRIRADCYLCWYIRALILFRSEEWGEAEQAFKALLEWKKDDPRIWFGLGLTYLARNKILESMEALIKAMKLEPGNEKYQLYLELARKILEKRGE